MKKNTNITKATKKVVKNVTKMAKKNPTATVAIGGGIIATAIGSITSSIVLKARLNKLQKNATTTPQNAPTTPETPNTTSSQTAPANPETQENPQEEPEEEK